MPSRTPRCRSCSARRAADLFNIQSDDQLPPRRSAITFGQMAPKDAAYPLTTEQSATHPGIATPAPEGALDQFVRRFAGDGVVNLFAAKTEVEAALRAGGGTLAAAPPLDDALPPG